MLIHSVKAHFLGATLEKSTRGHLGHDIGYICPAGMDTKLVSLAALEKNTTIPALCA